MPDDNRLPPDHTEDPNSDIPEIAPSTIFVELMRQAAAKRSQQAPAPEPPKVEPPKSDPSLSQSLFSAPPAPVRKPPTQPLVQPPAVPLTPLDTSSGVGFTDEPSEPVERPRPRRQRLRLDATEDPLISGQELQPLATPQPEPDHSASPVLPSIEERRNAARAEQNIAPEVAENNEKMEAQRVQRIKRRQEKVRRRRAGVAGGFMRTTLILLVASGLASTIFTWFTAPDFLDRKVVSGLVVAESTLSVTMQPTILPTPNYLKKIGVVSGHRGPQNDPGAVCPDGLTEASITFEVSTRVVRNLRALGYSVDLLDEFDDRLDDYQAAALVSIHANTCKDFGERVSGFLVAKASVRPEGGIDDVLAECIGKKYGDRIGLERRFNLTEDMTDYHTFREINQLTPAAIIELGFLKDDREILTTQQDAMAQAITDGVLCFLQPAPQNPNAQLTTPTFFDGTATPATP